MSFTISDLNKELDSGITISNNRLLLWIARAFADLSLIGSDSLTGFYSDSELLRNITVSAETLSSSNIHLIDGGTP